ncbi:hypothetical protein [Nitrosospira multiformis]|uniref:Uncharacterized protein n=1 Tax=Nitrosospira multiformis TaxID=1231 RepID=A0A1I7J1P6_9PROT|nr:hypothetical protein [Nitrosospira multiformis]SFU79103.1 hypothetical protein SAMN05216417_1418 [Nitrosospira multiformis]
MNISEAEKIKNPVLAFIGGVFFAFPIAWTVITYNHAEEIRIYESAKAEESKKSHDLEKKYLEQKNELQVKKDELLSLRKELEGASGKVTEDKTTRLQALIEQIDEQIAWKKHALTVQSNLKADQPKSDDYLRTEKEIDSLLSRRDQAQKQMIEVNAK